MTGLCLALLLFGGIDETSDAYILAVREPRIHAWAGIRGRKLGIRYTHASVPGRFVDVYGDHAYGADFRPTTLTWIDEGLLCVGGRSLTTKDTILEVWSFDEPSLVPSAEERSGMAIVADNRTTVVRVYAADAFGREGVQCIARMLGRETPTALVQFRDSHDVFVVDLTSGVMTLAASPVSSGAPLLDSRLAGEWSSFTAGTHRELGHVYALRTGGCLMPDDPEGTILLLFDVDRDGVLDRSGGYREWVEKRMSHPRDWED